MKNKALKRKSNVKRQSTRVTRRVRGHLKLRVVDADTTAAELQTIQHEVICRVCWVMVMALLLLLLLLHENY